MPEIQKRFPSQKPRKQKGRGRTYLIIGAFIIILATSIGVYLYETGAIAPAAAAPLYATLAVSNGTTNGTIEVELYRAQAPNTVSNFVNLAQTGFYRDLVWHRIATDPHVIQTGDPKTRYGNTSQSTWGTGGSSQTIPLEVGRGLSNTAGTLGMARGNALDSATSQFYVNVGDNTGLDTANGGYAVFGKIIKDTSNMVQAISNHPVSGETPLAPLPFLYSVTISSTA